MTSTGAVLVPALAFLVTMGAACQGADAVKAGYPFDGYLTVANYGNAESPLDVKRCGLSFFAQNPDGTFAGYHVDLDHFRATKKVRYLKYQNGVCIFDAARRIELCSVTFDTDPESQGKIFIDVVDAIGERYVRATSFPSLEDAQAYSTAGKNESGSPLTYFRCEFDQGKIAAALTEEISGLSAEDRGQVTLPGEKYLAGAEAGEIAAAVGLKQ